MGFRWGAVAASVVFVMSTFGTISSPASTGLVARDAEAVVLTGADVPAWSQLPAQGVPNPTPGPLDSGRDAHHGTVLTPPADARTGVPVGEVTAFAWDGGKGKWREVPVQVDERMPYHLANSPSDFFFYSGTDQELTYAWDVESWKKTAGTCFTEYEPGGGPTPDPVPGLDDDDEIAFMASDAGEAAPLGTPGPAGTVGRRMAVALADPLDPAVTRFVYLFRRPDGASFTAENGYVRYQRDADADQWIDRHSFPDDTLALERLGTSNTGYGPNLSGTVCDDPADPTTARASTDRFPRDGVTVSTPSYQWRATGRWMVRDMHVTSPGAGWTYGPDLIDRWKGRAFQQSPDSAISLVGFEDEQVNWEANSALLGERVGPVRAIREVWGADSGTNVTKVETFYRDAVSYRYYVRVHPIPPDGLYTSWDYNAGVATTYFNALKPEGVAIDGVNDDVGNVDGVEGFPAFFDAPDPTFDVPLANLRWEQVSGRDDFGSLVYIFELTGPTTAANPLVVPYYRDDKCFDDGTGDDPVPRPFPGEATTDPRVRDGYVTLAQQRTGDPALTYEDLTCDDRQGAWGSHGVHYFLTGDTDNAFTGAPVTEIDARQWQFAVPTEAPAAVGEPYANTVRAPLVATVVPEDNPAKANSGSGNGKGKGHGKGKP